MQQAQAANRAADGLHAFVHGLERNHYGWQAVHLHLSLLKPQNRRDYQLKVAASEFDALLRRYRSERFQLGNGDVLFIWESSERDAVQRVVGRLRYLFSDDPLAAEAVITEAADPSSGDRLRAFGEDAPEVPLEFCSWFDLDRDYDRLVRHLEDYAGSPAATNPLLGADGRQPLDPARLAQIETKLAGLDISDLVRRQAVCSGPPDSPPQVVFTEIHVAIQELASRLAPGVDLLADMWLFQRLVETLDRRLLASLHDGHTVAEVGPISLNLRLATLLSADFLQFDETYLRPTDSSVVIELQLVDIFAELGAYLFVRDFVRERGYMICIDGLHYLHLPLIERRRLGADLIKLCWSPELLEQNSAADELKQALRGGGIDRVILCRCDSAAAINWGHELGIRLFQGHYVDSRLRATRAPAVAAARRALREQAVP